MNRKPKTSVQNSNIFQIDPTQPDLSLIEKSVRVVNKGGMIVFPTRTLYGIGVDAFNVAAVNRLFQAKKRPVDKPVSVLVRSINDVTSLAAEIPSAAGKFMEIFWPGSLTIVFKARADVPSCLTAKTGKIGIRIPEHPVTVKLVAALDRPLTGTSANLSGEPGADCIADLPSEIITSVDMVVDSGKLKGGIGSTVVDVTTSPPTVIREGAVSEKELLGIY